MTIPPLGLRSLVVLFPKVPAELHPTKNQGLAVTLETVTAGTNRHVRTKGHACAACRGMVATPTDSLAVSNPADIAWASVSNVPTNSVTTAPRRE